MVKRIRTISCEDGDEFPENLLEIIKIEQTGYSSWGTPNGSGIKYRYRISGIFEEER